MFAGYGGPSSAEASVTAPALILGWKGRQEEERPAAAALYEDGTVGATGGEFELQVAMFEEVLCVAVLFIDVDPIIRCSLFRRFTRPSSLLGSSKGGDNGNIDEEKSTGGKMSIFIFSLSWVPDYIHATHLLPAAHLRTIQ
ncbi:uncharacterized protein LOC144466975 isoform X1 [Epinephelus lanceolatus]